MMAASRTTSDIVNAYHLAGVEAFKLIDVPAEGFVEWGAAAFYRRDDIEVPASVAPSDPGDLPDRPRFAQPSAE